MIFIFRQLDYDFITDHLYKFNVTVTDNGIIPRSGWARIVIYITNINDEKPRFRTGLEEIYFSIREDQTSGSYVTTIQASDPDNDKVEYYFTGKVYREALSILLWVPGAANGIIIKISTYRYSQTCL